MLYLSKIEKKTLRQQVYEQVHDLIISAELRPGEEVSLRQLEEDLGVSSTPIREALCQLEIQHVVSVEHDRRVRVNILSKNEILEIFDLRAEQEIQLIRDAFHNWNPAYLNRLTRIISALEKQTSTQNFLRLNRDFHFIFYQDTNRTITLNFVEILWLRLSPYLNNKLYYFNYLQHTTHHKKMLEAYRIKDSDRCIEEFTNDLLNTKNLLTAIHPD